MQAKTMTDMEKEYRRQLHALTQRIGDLCKQVNARDVRIRMLEDLLAISLKEDELGKRVDSISSGW